MSFQESIIKVKDISFSRAERQILDGVSFSIAKNKITAVLGPSGVGKTTILKLICGQLAPTSGEVEILGNQMSKIERKKKFELRKKIGVLFQSGALLNNLNVYDNVAFPLREHTDLSEEFIRYLVLTKLNAVGLSGASKLMTSELSGGMIRRAALARAIALDPEIIFYDEPFAGQDPIIMGVLLDLISKLNKAFSLTSVVITHDIEEIFKIADHVIVLNQAKVVEIGTPSQIENSQNEFVAQLLRKVTKDNESKNRKQSIDFKQELYS